MSRILILLVFLIPRPTCAQLAFESTINLGLIDRASEIKGYLLVKNIGLKKIYLLRADADKGVKVIASKKTLFENDTCLIEISFIPENSGDFKRRVSLVSSFRAAPYEIEIAGSLVQLVKDGKTDCYYFGKRDTKSETVPIKPEDTLSTQTYKSAEKESAKNESTNKLPEKLYHPNNIIFLVDISGSMKDSLKLPLMKKVLHHLIENIREIDKLTFITYADTIKIISEAKNSVESPFLHATVENMKAKGMTKGKKAILLGQQIAQTNFIEEGNNQIIIATDGKFKFEKEDQKKWEANQGSKRIIISTLAFGNDKLALRQLKQISKKGNGSFIHLTNWNQNDDKLLEEIKYRSRK